MMKVSSKGAKSSTYKLATVKGLSELANDPTKATEKVTQSLGSFQIQGRVTAVQSFDQMLFLATDAGSVRIIDIASKGDIVKENIHLAVSLY